ncbi:MULTISPECIES: MFS transporter [Pseudomonas]|uniref:Hexuronate transporter n=1 Tax=Pseudomonas fluorescens TaxID=294 RepID=A0A5E7VNV0_PSEFL|nr:MULTISPECIES: MFS transporter [Pseudomonas]OPK11340.1 multidrug DMT transporter permease [Pseudomonas sp. VI4.1]VVQ24135.1 Hexuronate transporter [Pseudomonas fluorescens]
MAYHSTVDDAEDTSVGIPRKYAWAVFALTFGLLISDYMSRQVLNAVFPILKGEWALSDGQLGLLSGIVALMVGTLTIPLSLLADRFGRVKSLALMALLWSLATLGCALAENYEEMLIARFMVGVGEAAYGSVGIAVVVSVFPKNMRATLASAFMAGAMFGSVLGISLGGAIAVKLGWRWSFASMALFGLVLAAIYPIVVKEARIAPQRLAAAGSKLKGTVKRPLRTLYGTRSVIAAYVASGLQTFVAGSMIVWMPSYFNRYYGMGEGKAGVVAGVMVLCCGGGAIMCGMLSDRLSRQSPLRKIELSIAFCLGSCLLMSLALIQSVGPLQLALIGMAMLFVTGTNGPTIATIANLTHYKVHGTAFAALTLVNNMLGLAPGPFVTGRVSDHIGLHGAFQLIPLMSIAAAAVFFYIRCHYLDDIARVQGKDVDDASTKAVMEVSS